MKNYRSFFVDPSEEGFKWDYKFIEMFNNNKREELWDFIRKTETNKLYMDEYRIMSFINEFTKKENQKNENKKTHNSLLKRDRYIKNIEVKIKENDNISKLKIETIKGDIFVGLLSEFLPKIAEEYPEVETDARSGKCHERSYEIAKKLEIENKLVTGYVYGMSDKAKYLHSWIETTVNGKEAVIDYTMNAVINKTGYYQLQHADPISMISNKDVKEDSKTYLNKFKSNEISLLEYLLFRDEIIKDLNKNKEMFLSER